MKKRFLQEARRRGYFDSHQKVLLALSGGLDSMTLFQLLYDCRADLGIELGLAHVNHGQRPESDFEERELKKMAEKLGVRMFASSFSGPFSEQKARDFRYRFFAEVMRQESYTALLTAHHADDQAETVLMRLLRGSRLRHLTGMADRQPFAEGELIRPLLSFSKSEFPAVHHFEDSSNQDNTYLRNRIRNTYLPLLEEENPQIRQALLDLGQETADLTAALQGLTAGMDVQDLAFFHQQPASLQRFLLQNYLLTFPNLQLSKVQFEELLTILLTKANYRHPLKGGYELYKDYSRFEIQKISRKPDLKTDSILLELNHLIHFGNYRFSFGLPLEGKGVERVSVSCETPIVLRQRETGDRILLNGHHKKIRRLFIDRKIPLSQREEAVIVEQNHHILTIPNIAVSDLSKDLKNDIMVTTLYIQQLDR